MSYSESERRPSAGVSAGDSMGVVKSPSELESFGLAALEAMACEVVPISTRAGGVPEVIDHGTSGFLADVGDVVRDAPRHAHREIHIPPIGINFQPRIAVFAGVRRHLLCL